MHTVMNREGVRIPDNTYVILMCEGEIMLGTCCNSLFDIPHRGADVVGCGWCLLTAVATSYVGWGWAPVGAEWTPGAPLAAALATACGCGGGE